MAHLERAITQLVHSLIKRNLENEVSTLFKSLPTSQFDGPLSLRPALSGLKSDHSEDDTLY